MRLMAQRKKLLRLLRPLRHNSINHTNAVTFVGVEVTRLISINEFVQFLSKAIRVHPCSSAVKAA